MIRIITSHGGRVVCDAPVAGVEADADGVRRVLTASGGSVKVGRAVVAGGHLAQLGSMLTGITPTPDLVQAAETWRPGLSVFAFHAALRADLTFGQDTIPSVAAGYSTTDRIARQLDLHNAGELDTEDAWLLVVNQTAVDPFRARPGRPGHAQDPHHRAIHAGIR